MNYQGKIVWVAEIILVNKLGKDPKNVTSYSLSLLSSVSKLPKNYCLKELILTSHLTIRFHIISLAFDGVIKHCHQVTNYINRALENK